MRDEVVAHVTAAPRVDVAGNTTPNVDVDGIFTVPDVFENVTDEVAPGNAVIDAPRVEVDTKLTGIVDVVVPIVTVPETAAPNVDVAGNTTPNVEVDGMFTVLETGIFTVELTGKAIDAPKDDVDKNETGIVEVVDHSVSTPIVPPDITKPSAVDDCAANRANFVT